MREKLLNVKWNLISKWEYLIQKLKVKLNTKFIIVKYIKERAIMHKG